MADHGGTIHKLIVRLLAGMTGLIGLIIALDIAVSWL
jgi:hypothetical protein